MLWSYHSSSHGFPHLKDWVEVGFVGSKIECLSTCAKNFVSCHLVGISGSPSTSLGKGPNWGMRSFTADSISKSSIVVRFWETSINSKVIKLLFRRRDLQRSLELSEAMYYKQTFFFLMMELFRYRYRQDLQHLDPESWTTHIRRPTKISFPLWPYSEKKPREIWKVTLGKCCDLTPEL